MNLTTRAQRYLRLDLTIEDALPTRMPVYVNSVAYLFGAATMMALAMIGELAALVKVTLDGSPPW